jgi:predicted nucleotidyltransferase
MKPKSHKLPKRAQLQVGKLLKRASADPDVLAVILFGSHARGEAMPSSDVDVCLVAWEKFRSKKGFLSFKCAI